MKVALLGARGSGKTDVGKRLVRGLNRDPGDQHWKLIDDYVPYLAKSTGRAYGIQGDIPHNIQIMAERWTLEAQTLKVGLHTVTCGSIYETIVYTALTRLTPPVDEQEMLEWNREARVAMQFLNLMEQMTFNYDVLLYLPLPADAKRDWPAVVDAKLPEVLAGCFRYAVPLHEPTLRQKVTHGLQVIRHIRDTADAIAAEAPSDDQPAV